MVSALDRKVLRDLGRMKGQMLAIVLLVACGVTTFVGSMATWRSLMRSQQDYYERYRFADVFASLRRAPETLSRRLAAVPGVAEVQTRVVADATLEMEGFDEPVTARFVSVPSSGLPALNRFHVRAGRALSPGAESEVVVSEGFATSHRLRTGDRISAVIQGRRQTFTVVGIGLSPEFVYEIRPGDLMPDDKHFGIFWTSRQQLEAASDMEGAFNDFAARLEPGASGQEVLAAFDRELASYGGLGAYLRKDQISNRFLSDEIRQLKANAVIIPAIFLGVAAFLLNVVLTRLVGTQREQIATLKALGYSNLAAGLHYAKLVALVALFGAALGVAGGTWMSRAMTGVYAQYYRLPQYFVEIPWQETIIAAGLATAAASVGVFGAVRRVVRLPPAEAMRPEPPATYRPSWIERVGVDRIASAAGRMILRNVGRRPVRFGLSSLGISFAIAILVVGWFFFDALDYIVDYQFRHVQRDDAMVSFTTPLSREAVSDLRHVPGVVRTEAYRAVPVRLRAGHVTYRTALLGMDTSGELRRVVDRKRGPLMVPAEGVLLTSKLAEMLGVRPGDMVTAEVLEGRRPVRSVVVSGTVEELMGVSAYMSLPAVHRLMDEGPSASGAFLSVDPAQERLLYARLMSMPRVAGVTLRSAAIHSFTSTSAEFMLFFASILVAFAWVIAAGIVYNSARISLAERERELATMRVIGMTWFEVWLIVIGELALQLLFAIPVGCVVGYGFAQLAASSVDTDLYRIPVFILPSTYAMSVGVVVVAAVVVGLTISRRVRRLDLVAVLKSKE
jgi:putative ABC transport system permease protein